MSAGDRSRSIAELASNGIEAEGWASLRDYKIDDWSGGLNRQNFWIANSHAPALSYINHKFNIDGATVSDPQNTGVSESFATTWSLVRVPGAAFMDTTDVPHGAVARITYKSSAAGKNRRAASERTSSMIASAFATLTLSASRKSVSSRMAL